VENFPSNSQEARASDNKGTEKEEPKKILTVVKGPVTRRKKTLGARFLEMFFGEDSKGVGSYVVAEVLIPALKDMIADAVTQGIERKIFGETRSVSRRTGSRPGAPSNHVNYSRYSKPSVVVNEPRSIASRRGRLHDFGDIVIGTRAEAEEVLETMFDLIDRYNMVSVAELKELLGVRNTHVDEKWGWTSLENASVSRIREGYVLNLPRTEEL